MNKQYFNALGVLKPNFHLNKHAKSNIGIKSLENLGQILSLPENPQRDIAENFCGNVESESSGIKNPMFDLNYYEVPEFYRKSPSEFVE